MAIRFEKQSEGSQEQALGGAEEAEIAYLDEALGQDMMEFMVDLQTVYQAATREEAEANLLKLEQTWAGKYGAAVRSWQNNWDDLATFFAYPQEIRRLIYTTNTVEGYHRQLRKVIKTKGAFPTEQAVRKLLYLATMDITKKWTAPIQNWPMILNQLAIRFEDRWPE